ncbi:MAG: HEAT repeat domain-containing protein [Kaiparowitsia implicata GSE-PSE-MK54-09C]|jgi:HEAT repeat protein|nr:HEAT repeat domain-containing protein [Kaiparowitsia implicata GSE-PSE-MK54-09C]
MVVELLTPVASWALGKAADSVWTLATDQVQTMLQRTDIKQAIAAGLEAVREWEQSLEVPALLFKSCDDKQKRQFLEQVFADAGVVEQLQRPLVGKGEPDVGLLLAYFEGIGRDISIQLTIASLPQWLQIFSTTYVEKTALFTKYEVARQRYLKQLAHWYDDVKFLGISVAGQEDTKSEKLLQIFVMPDVKQRAESWQQEQLSQQIFFESESNLIEMVDYPEAVVGHPQSRLMMEQRQLTSRLKQEGKVFSADALLQQSRSQRCVLLGAPGSGKTTLMSYFAVAFTTEETPVNLGLAGEHLPILVRIRDWVRSTHTNLLDYVRWFATDKLAVKDLPTGFFEHWLEAGKALILLDGLDEVASESRRDEVVNQIECFLQHDAYRHNPAIITSRPAGYKQAYFRTEEFPHYDLQPFDQAKIDQFIQNWYDNRFRDREESQRRQQTLKQALSERDRIQVLAKNPLLLTIIALIHRYEAYLPRDRHQLYNRAVETLLTNWDANKETDYKWPLEYIKRDAVRRIMEQLAYWIHSYGSAGDAEGGTLIDRGELIHQLGRFIVEEAGIKRYQAEAEAQRFLDHIRERTGLLNEQGQDCYAFVHKTFQEYLCAQEIKHRADEEYDLELILTPIREHLHEPHWEEVLLLLIAQQPKKRVAKIIQQILAHPAPYEQWLHRNLFFAAACLAENVEITDTKLIERILNSLVDFMATESPLIASRLQRQATKCLRNLGETTFQNLALQRLEAQHSKIDPIQLQQLRFALGQTALATAALVALLSDDDSNVYESAASALGKLAQASSEVVTALINCLGDDNRHVYESAASALGKLAQASPEVVTALINGLRDDDSNVRSSAAEALGQLAQASSEVVTALTNCLSDDNRHVRIIAASALGKLAQASPEVVTALINGLRDDANSVRFRAAEALGQLAQASPEVVPVLINGLRDDASSVRSSAAEALGQLAQASPEVVTALTNCLSDDKSWLVRCRAASALGKLAQASPEVVPVLINGLRDDASNVRSSAASALGQLAQASPEVVTALINGLRDEESSVRSSAAYALGRLAQASPEVVPVLINGLRDDASSVRSSAASALGQLAQASPEVVTALINGLSDDKSWLVRFRAASALGQLAQASPEVVTALINGLSDEESSVRYGAAEALGKLGKQTNTVATQLANWIEQNQNSDPVGHGIDALWAAIMTEQA